MKRILAIFLAALLSMALLTSCTGNGTGESTTETNPVVAEPDTTPAPEGEGSTETTPDDNSEGNWTKNY